MLFKNVPHLLLLSHGSYARQEVRWASSSNGSTSHQLIPQVGYLAPEIALEVDAARSRSQHSLGEFLLRPHRYKRHKWTSPPALPDEEALQKTPVTIGSWIVLLMMLQFFAAVYYIVMHYWPSYNRYHSAVVLFWIVAAASHLLVIWWMGNQDPVQWISGYLIEIIGSVENIFIFHIIIKAFRVPMNGVQHILFLVVCCQVAYQFFLFMVVGADLQLMWLLPFLLGPWLIYCGYHAAQADDQESLRFSKFVGYRVCKALLGDRLGNTYNGNSLVALGNDGRLRSTLLLPALLCLILADFFLELDTTLVKIEELSNEYSCFSSSAFAAFAVPEFYFLARDVFQRYPSFKLGIAFSLTLFGADMLVSNFLTIPPLTSCLMVFLIFLAIIVWSKIMEFFFPGTGYVCAGKTDAAYDAEILQDSETGLAKPEKVYGSVA